MCERVSDEMCISDVQCCSFWALSRAVGVTYLTISFVLVIVLGDNGGGSKDDYKYRKMHRIHHSMKKKDLTRIFGVDDINIVPPYEVVRPLIHDTAYDFMSDEEILRVKRRDDLYDDQPPQPRFGVSAFNCEYHFNLSLNEDLFAPNFRVEVKHRHGTVRKKSSPTCHYTGKICGKDDSLVALSTCHGLSGYFTADEYDYFIEPLPHYLHNIEGEAYHKPHVIIRRSAEEMFDGPLRLQESFSRMWYKGNSPLKRTCATPGDPNIRMVRSADDDIPYATKDTDVPPKPVGSEKYVETLVVVDQKMVHYHGEDAATQFALVVLNIVASLLRDGSIGANLIILVVVKLELHTVDVPGLVINHHARNTLESFGSWAARGSDQDDRSDDHYDYGILITRYNICADETQPCDLLGVAQTGGMCNWPYSASVNKDNGFPLAFTITHSIGHSLGMNHDGDESSYICPDNTYIMASSISSEWMETRKLWSRCSRNYLRQFLKKSQASCLNDLPAKSRSLDYSIMDNKPGILYDASKQCEMQFGTGSTVCRRDASPGICQRLLCTNPTNVDKCFTSIYPAVDGTSCAPNRWCYRGKCVGNKEVVAIDGVWSSWSANFLPCSRSCGGGVQYKIRQCNNPKPGNGGKLCEGSSRSYQLCNTKPCSNGMHSHRSMQCSRLDNRLFGERKFDWEFKPSKIEPCKLGCFIAGTGHGYDFGSVEDGTNCDQLDESVIADKCINGECKSVGCDGVLGSHAKFDRCGVCDGDGSSCLNGMEKSVVPDPTNNGMSLALASLKDIGFDLGSLYGKSALSLNQKRSGIARRGDFVWARIKSGCPVSCGGGIEILTAECRRQDDGSPSREEMCDPALRPPLQNYPCKEEACPPVWKTSYWGDCTKTCNGGVKKRNVRCIQRSGNGVEYSVDPSLCTGHMPADTEGCNKEPCPSEWIAQPFGECSTICGPGIQIRTVFCQKVLKDGTILSGKVGECRPETKPPTEQKCNVHNPCPGDGNCGGIYTDPVGNFSSPNYPKNYSNNMECIHIIQVPEKAVIKLEFEDVGIVAPSNDECKNDFVKIMDGDCVSRLGESKVCGHAIPPPFVSTTNRVCVKFFSDDSQTDKGFAVKYHAIDEPLQRSDMCGTNITSPAGLISSPNYPDYYPPNEDCNITVSGDEKPIHLTFHAFDVGSDDCTNDYVYLMGGESDQRLCGQKLPGIYTTTGKNDLLVRFVSTDHATTMKPGFVATYTSESSSSAATYPSVSALDKSTDASSVVKKEKITMVGSKKTEMTIPQSLIVLSKTTSSVEKTPPLLDDKVDLAQKSDSVPSVQNETNDMSVLKDVFSATKDAEDLPPQSMSQGRLKPSDQPLLGVKKDAVENKGIILHRGEQPDSPPEEELQAPTFINTVLHDNKNTIYSRPLLSYGGGYKADMYNTPADLVNTERTNPFHRVFPFSGRKSVPHGEVKFSSIESLSSLSPSVVVHYPPVKHSFLTSSPIDRQPSFTSPIFTHHPSFTSPSPNHRATFSTPSIGNHPANSVFRSVARPQAKFERTRRRRGRGGNGKDFIPSRPLGESLYKAHSYGPVAFVSTQPDGIAMEVDTTTKRNYIPSRLVAKIAAYRDGDYVVLDGMRFAKKDLREKYVKKKNVYNSDYITRSEQDVNKKVYYNHGSRLESNALAAAYFENVPARRLMIKPSNFLNRKAEKALAEMKDDIASEEELYDVCPPSEDLKCIRLLYSFSCDSDTTCGNGFVCCPTSCDYGRRMCTPMISKHCPLRDPYYYPQLPCNVDTDCPNNSPCCLDMSNKRYCRHRLSNKRTHVQRIPFQRVMLFG